MKHHTLCAAALAVALLAPALHAQQKRPIERADQLEPAGAQLLVQADGNGLNPLLRHPGMIIHPPMLYLGFVSFTIPYAFAIAALITGRTDDRWIRITRRWTLVAWLFSMLVSGRGKQKLESK